MIILKTNITIENEAN